MTTLKRISSEETLGRISSVTRNGLDCEGEKELDQNIITNTDDGSSEMYNEFVQLNLIKNCNNVETSGTNIIYTIFLIVNAALGAGLLNFPKSVDEAGGIIVTTVVQLILLAFIMIALIALAYSSDQCGKNGASTIQETMEGVTGPVGRMITSTTVVVYTFGVTITFLIIIGDQFELMFGSLYGPNFVDYWYMKRDFTTSVCSIFFILPLCYSKRIDFLRIPSSLGVIAILYLVGLTIYEYYVGNYIPGPIKTSPSNFTDAFLVVPVICFGYQCHVSVIPIYSCMKKRNLKNFGISVSVAIAICVACYSLTAVFGYLTFGSYVKDDILMSYKGGFLVYIGMVAMALKIITTYPILLFCGREALTTLMIDIESNIFPLKKFRLGRGTKKGSAIYSQQQDFPVKSNCRIQQEPAQIGSNYSTHTGGMSETKNAEEHYARTEHCSEYSSGTINRQIKWGKKKETIVRYVSVTIWFGLSLILAVSIDNIGDVIKMLGSLAAIFIFIFPGLCMCHCALGSDPNVLRKRYRYLIIVTSFVFIALGAFIFGVVFVQAINSLLF